MYKNARYLDIVQLRRFHKVDRSLNCVSVMESLSLHPVHWQAQGGGARDVRWPIFFSFSCSFQEKLPKKIDWHLHL